MSKFATAAPPAVRGFIVTSAVPDAATHEGGEGFSRDAKSELFLLAVANMVREDTFYDERATSGYDAKDRAFRFADVIELTHPKPKADWQSALFRYCLNDRHGHETDLSALPLLAARSSAKETGDTEAQVAAEQDWQA